MSATTPAVRGGLGSQRLGTALVAIALAIVVIAALIGFAALSGRMTAVAPAAAPAPAPAVQFDRGWANDKGKAGPAFSVAGDHAAATDGSGVTAPVNLAPNGGRGTRLAR
jgi:hypothetical protein